jgi:hypothetical protein
MTLARFLTTPGRLGLALLLVIGAAAGAGRPCRASVPWGAARGVAVAAQDTTSAMLPLRGRRHEVGIVASAFFKLFEEDEESYALNYRLRLSRRHAMRAALSYTYTSEGSGRLDLSARLGYDRVFREDGAWRFYVGLDAVGAHERLNNGERQTLRVGVAPVLGASYRVGSRLRLGAEPRLLVRRGWARRDGALTDRWWEMELAGIGELIISVIF